MEPLGSAEVGAPAPPGWGRDDALDGNAAAGALADLYGREMTEARVTCGGCGSVAVVATLVVYAHGMGTVVRCRSCDRALLRVGRVRGGYRLDTSGCAAVRAADGGEARSDAASARQ